MGDERKLAVGSEWKIRAGLPSDLAGLSEILRESPEAAGGPGPCFSDSDNSSGYLWLVCESQGAVVGFLAGRQVLDQAEIHNLGVRPVERRRGIGKALLGAALAEFGKRGASHLYLEVRESNQRAIALYRSQGFVERGTRPGYYRNPEERAVLMDRNLDG